jgi:hypothetical protein
MLTVLGRLARAALSYWSKDAEALSTEHSPSKDVALAGLTTPALST